MRMEGPQAVRSFPRPCGFSDFHPVAAPAYPPPVDVTVDYRMHLTDTTITSTGYRDATVTIEGGAINIICCS